MRRSWSISSWLRAISVPISLRAICMLFLVASRSLFTPVTSPFSLFTSSALAFVASCVFTMLSSPVQFLVHQDRRGLVLLACGKQFRLRQVQLVGHDLQVALQLLVDFVFLCKPLAKASLAVSPMLGWLCSMLLAWLSALQPTPRPISDTRPIPPPPNQPNAASPRWCGDESVLETRSWTSSPLRHPPWRTIEGASPTPNARPVVEKVVMPMPITG